MNKVPAEIRADALTPQPSPRLENRRGEGKEGETREERGERSRGGEEKKKKEEEEEEEKGQEKGRGRRFFFKYLCGIESDHIRE